MPPIFIPSKGRPFGSTMRWLKAENIPFTVVVEPQERGIYEEQGMTTMVLPCSERGIGYARKMILEHMATEDFIMMDDDLHGFYMYGTDGDGTRRLQKSRTFRAFLEAWLVCIREIRETYPETGMIGCKQTTFAIPKKIPYTWCTEIAHMIYFHVPVLRKHVITYRDDVRMFEDIRILIEARLRSGSPRAFVRCNHLIYYTQAPSGCAKSGGVEYGNGAKEAALDVLVQEYPMWVEKQAKLTRYAQPKYTVDWRGLMHTTEFR